MPTPLEVFESKLTWRHDDLFPSRDVVERSAIIGRDVCNAFLLVYQQTRGTADQQAVLGETIREGYTKYIAPLDLPGVGPVIENLIDSYLPTFLASLPAQADAWLDKKLPNPVPPATT